MEGVDKKRHEGGKRLLVDTLGALLDAAPRLLAVLLQYPEQGLHERIPQVDRIDGSTAAPIVHPWVALHGRQHQLRRHLGQFCLLLL